MFVNVMRWLPLLGCCLFLVGCGGNLATVTGKVVFEDGTSPEEGEVIFAWTEAGEGGRTATGTIESDGTFALSTYGSEDGAHYGKHQIHIASCTPECKEKYSDADNPFMEVEVTSSGDNNFELKIEKAN